MAGLFGGMMERRRAQRYPIIQVTKERRPIEGIKRDRTQEDLIPILKAGVEISAGSRLLTPISWKPPHNVSGIVCRSFGCRSNRWRD